MRETKIKLQNIFRRAFGRNNIVLFNQMTAKDIEEWDSLMHITLIIAIEKDFSIKFTLDELVELKNVGDTIRLIEKKLKSKIPK